MKEYISMYDIIQYFPEEDKSAIKIAIEMVELINEAYNAGIQIGALTNNSK